LVVIGRSTVVLVIMISGRVSMVWDTIGMADIRNTITMPNILN